MKVCLFRTVPLSIIRSFSLYTQQWYVSYRFADSLRAESCAQAVSKLVWHISLLCVQWKSPDDGQRNFPKHVDFHSKNKFEKLVRLVGFIVRNVLLRLAQSLVFAISSVDRPVWVMWLVDSCGWLMSVSVGWIIGVLVIRCYEIHAFLGRALRRHRSCAVMAVLRLCSPP